MDSEDIVLDSLSGVTHSQVCSDDEEELLFDPLMDLSHCSDFDNESISCSESVLLGGNDGQRTKAVPAVVKVKTEKIDAPKVASVKKANVGERKVASQSEAGPWRRRKRTKEVEAGSGDTRTVAIAPPRSMVIKLNQPRKFRYVPDYLPYVEMPSLYNKRKRPASTTCFYKDIEPTLLLEPKRRNTDTLQDPVRQTKIFLPQTGEAELIRRSSPPSTVVNTCRRVVQETHPKRSSQKDGVIPATPPVPSPQRRLITTSSSSTLSPRRRRKLTSHSEAVQLDVSTVARDNASEPLGVGAMDRASVFATRPGIINRGDHSKFSLQHLGAKTTFSLGHL